MNAKPLAPPTHWGYLLPICLVATLGGLLFGYDTGVISGAIEPLTAKFGLSSAMTGWASGCVLLGCAAGVLTVGPLSDRYGRRLAMFLAALMFFISAVGTTFPTDIWTFIVFRFLGGLGIGIASISTPMYIAEITPAHLRGRLIAVNQIAIVGGLALVYFANYGIAKKGPGLAGVAEPSTVLAETLKSHLEPTAISMVNATVGVPRGTADGIQSGMDCAIGVLPDASKTKPTRVGLATITAVGEHEFTAHIPNPSANAAIASLQASVADYPKLVVTVLSPSESWNIHTGWRWMFASGILPSLLFGLLLLAIPESPRWLIEQRREDEARAVMTKVAGPAFAASESAAIKASLAGEQGTWRELLSPRLRLPLTLGIALAILQQVTGINVFMYFGTTIFNNLSSETGIDAGMLAQAIIGGSGVLFTIIAIATVDKWGRKPLMFIGTAGMMVSLIGMGLMAQLLEDPTTASAAMLGFIILYIACFGLSVGPVVWVILAEIFPTAVRGRALGLATCCLWLADYLVTQTFPMMDKNPWLIAKMNHAFPFYIYAFFCIVLLVVMRFVPETKGRSLEEIESSWGSRK
ncbi:MAG: sugar porter family MFS transporter [Akkermansiaceae bacterium]|nr:sugar porter family MFS transporter [Akkermansiaceae bacterium]